MRLDRYLCKSTHHTRAEAQALIVSGAVAVNGIAALNPAMQVHENNRITLRGEPLLPRPFRYLMLHKPAGTICASGDEHYPSIFNLIDIERVGELHVAGRLDADTTGLVLLTDDGRWSFHLTAPQSHCSKRYRVWLRDPLANDTASRFAEGLLLQGESKPTLPAGLESVTEREVLLTLTEGRFHQVKRMFKAVGNRVVRLHREQVGTLRLDLAQGQWRMLSRDEVEALRRG